jgi:hypothetical protein
LSNKKHGIRKKKRLGIVPRALLGATLAGAVPASVVPACGGRTVSTPDGPEFTVDAGPPPPDAGSPEFSVDAAGPDVAAPPPDAGSPEFSVDAGPVD